MFLLSIFNTLKGDELEKGLRAGFPHQNLFSCPFINRYCLNSYQTTFDKVFFLEIYHWLDHHEWPTRRALAEYFGQAGIASQYCRLHLLNTFAAHRHSSVLIWQGWKLWPPICAANHSQALPNRALSLDEMPGLRAVLPDFLSKHWEWAPPCSLKCRLAGPGRSRYLWPFSPAWSHPGVRRENLEVANSANTF